MLARWNAGIHFSSYTNESQHVHKSGRYRLLALLPYFFCRNRKARIQALRETTWNTRVLVAVKNTPEKDVVNGAFVVTLG